MALICRATMVWVTAVLSAAACARSATSDAGEDVVRQGSRLTIPEHSPLRSRIAVDTVAVALVPESFVATAVVEADPEHVARIVPPLAGRVVKLYVRFGDVVEAGQPLVTIDSPDFAAALADYRRAESAMTLGSRAHERVLDLQRNGVASVRDVEQAESDLSQARSEFERASSRLRTLGVDPGATTSGRTLEVRAPFRGVVDDVSTAEGEFRNDASAPLMTIADISTVWLTANVQEKDIHAVRTGQSVDAVFAAYPGSHASGTVHFIGTVLDPDTRTVKVRVRLANESRRFKPGMFATVTFLGEAGDALVVPTDAVVQLRDTTYAYAEVAPWTFEARPVGIGQQLSGKTVIRSGLARGDRVIVRGALLLQ